MRPRLGGKKNSASPRSGMRYKISTNFFQSMPLNSIYELRVREAYSIGISDDHVNTESYDSYVLSSRTWSTLQ